MEHAKMHCWGIFEVADTQHVVPCDEAHKLDNTCNCGWHIHEGVIVHHSYDGREAFESGERKPS